MLVKLTSKNQLALPKNVTDALGAVEYFDVQAKGGQIILTPVRIQRTGSARAKSAGRDLTDAVTWARIPQAAKRDRAKKKLVELRKTAKVGRV